MTSINGAQVRKVVVACDAGMGSSVMLASQLRRQLEPHSVGVEHTPVNSIPRTPTWWSATPDSPIGREPALPTR
jgi:mannitol-specific phosphotransferase system IIBC component